MLFQIKFVRHVALSAASLSNLTETILALLLTCLNCVTVLVRQLTNFSSVLTFSLSMLFHLLVITIFFFDYLYHLVSIVPCSATVFQKDGLSEIHKIELTKKFHYKTYSYPIKTTCTRATIYSIQTLISLIELLPKYSIYY